MQAATATRMVSKPQSQFGIHDVEGVLYLWQDTYPDGVPLVEPKQRRNYLSGRNIDLAGIGGACSHNLNPHVMRSRLPNSQWKQFHDLVRDPLVELFLPVPAEVKQLPKSPVYLINGGFNQNAYLVIKNLERLCSPVHSQIQSVSRLTPERLSRITQLTNIHPVVAVMDRDSPDYWKTLPAYLSENQPERPVLIVATGAKFETLAAQEGVHVINTSLTASHIASQLTTLPLEQLGSRVLGHYCVFRSLDEL